MPVKDVTSGNGIMSTGIGMPNISGTWENTRTGDRFTVRDCYFENNNLMVATTDGRFIGYNQLQEYVQATDQSGKPVKIQSESALPAEVQDLLEVSAGGDTGVDDLLLPEDRVISSGFTSTSFPPADMNKPSLPGITFSAKDEPNPNTLIIERALKNTPLPEPSIKLKWKVPTKELDALTDILGIPVEDIANWYISNIDLEVLKNAFIQEIRNTIAKPLK